ncbi:hypothetical protein ACSSS7_001679 [Eimeria intestinalis]
MAPVQNCRAATVAIFAAFLLACAIAPSFTSEEQEGIAAAPSIPADTPSSENAESSSGDSSASDGEKGDALSALDDLTTGGILEKVKNFPLLGEHGASLLQLAEEGLGFNASKLELSKIVPMLAELQKNVHDHYMVTKGSYQPSSLLKRVVSRKSKTRVIRSMKKFAPNTDEGELMQQLDAVTHVLHQLHTNPQTNMRDILHSVSSALGLDLEDEEMQELSTHMQWAQSLMQKFMPLISRAIPGSQKAEEL